MATKLEDSSPIMGIVVVPVFPDVDLRQWLSWMEHYFARKGLTDLEKLHMAFGFIVGEAERYIHDIDSLMPIRSWKHMKETLLLKFGAEDDPERIRLQIESDRSYEYLLNGKPQRKSETIQEKSSEDDKLVIHPTLSSLGMSCPTVEVKVKNEPTSSNEADCKTDMAHKITSSLVEDVSLSDLAVEVNLKDNMVLDRDVVCEIEVEKQTATMEDVSVASVAGTIHQQKSSHVPVQETEAILKNSLAETDLETEVEIQNDSLEEMEKRTVLKREISLSDCVAKADSSLVKGPSYLVKGTQHDALTTCKNSVLEIGVVQEMHSPSTEKTEVMSYNGTAVLKFAIMDASCKQSDDSMSYLLHPSSFTHMVSSEASTMNLYGFMVVREDAENFKNFQVLTDMLQDYYAQQEVTHARKITSEHQ